MRGYPEIDAGGLDDGGTERLEQVTPLEVVVRRDGCAPECRDTLGNELAGQYRKLAGQVERTPRISVAGFPDCLRDLFVDVPEGCREGALSESADSRDQGIVKRSEHSLR